MTDNIIEFKPSTKPPVIDAGGSIPRSTIEAALTRWQEHRKHLELDTVAANTVIAELTALLVPVPEQVPVNPVPKTHSTKEESDDRT